MNTAEIVKVLVAPEEITSLIPIVYSLADSNRASLGFLPRTAFLQQAFRGRLWVAVSEETGECLGFLLFGGRYPCLKVFQLLISLKHRRRGIAQNLVNRLVEYGEKNNYLSISARVAADISANRFWEKARFHLVRQVPGGKKSGRNINILVRELNTPSLLKLMNYEAAVPATSIKDIRFHQGPISPSPNYVLDLNVFFDVVRDRLYRKEASQLIRAGLNNQIRVCVSPEFSKELERHSRPGKSDPILEFAKEIPTLPKVEPSEIDKLIPELRAMIFPDRSLRGKKKDQVHSDLVHLAYCIHHRVIGFITRESAILEASNQLQESYFLEVLSPVDLFEAPQDLNGSEEISVHACLGERNVQVNEANETEREEAEKFLIGLGLSSKMVPTVWSPGTSGSLRRRICVRFEQVLVGIASWDEPSKFNRNNQLYFYIDEKAPQCERVIDNVFETVLRQSETLRSRTIKLHTSPEQALTRTTALQRGFVESFPLSDSMEPSSLTKFTFHGIITTSLWPVVTQDFKDLTGLHLPSVMPSFREFINTGLAIKNEKGIIFSRLKLFDFETLISPGMIACNGRTGVILPIRAYFAKDLFLNINDQMELYPSREAILHVEKAYFRSPRRVDLFVRGKPVVFYLSGSGGGTKEVIGSARITYSEVLAVEKIFTSLSRQGVLEPDALREMANNSGRLHVFTFDNFISFPNRIPFRYLLEHKLVSKANLVTAELLHSEKLHEIWCCGFGLESN